VGSRDGVDDMEKREFLTLPEHELRPLDRRAFSKSLYLLRYPGSHALLLAVLNVRVLTLQRSQISCI
jgi:hypothetical protein